MELTEAVKVVEKIRDAFGPCTGVYEGATIEELIRELQDVLDQGGVVEDYVGQLLRAETAFLSAEEEQQVLESVERVYPNVVKRYRQFHDVEEWKPVTEFPQPYQDAVRLYVSHTNRVIHELYCYTNRKLQELIEKVDELVKFEQRMVRENSRTNTDYNETISQPRYAAARRLRRAAKKERLKRVVHSGQTVTEWASSALPEE